MTRRDDVFLSQMDLGLTTGCAESSSTTPWSTPGPRPSPCPPDSSINWGHMKIYEKQARSTHGFGPVAVYQAVRLTIGGRFCTVDVLEVPDDTPALVGQIPLEMLDLVVDLQGRRLTGNPAHNGEHILELS